MDQVAAVRVANDFGARRVRVTSRVVGGTPSNRDAFNRDWNALGSRTGSKPIRELFLRLWVRPNTILICRWEWEWERAEMKGKREGELGRIEGHGPPHDSYYLHTSL